MGLQSNAQGEVQLLAEWLTQAPAHWKSKTNIPVGKQSLIYNGVTVATSRARAFEVWSDRADARVFTGTEVWIVEAKLVGVGGAYGQVMDYMDEYPESEDYQQFAGYPIFGVVLVAAERRRTASLFLQHGVRTIVFTPSWSLRKIGTKLYGSTGNL